MAVKDSPCEPLLQDFLDWRSLGMAIMVLTTFAALLEDTEYID